jgi:hypothetical protein
MIIRDASCPFHRRTATGRSLLAGSACSARRRCAGRCTSRSCRSDEPEDPLGLVEDEEGEDGEDGDGDGEVEGDAMEPEVPALPVEPDEPEVPPPIEEPDVPLAPAGGESVADLLHPAIAMVITLAARTILVALSIEFIVVPFIRIVYPSIQIPLTPSFWISFIQKFGVA